MALTVCWLDVPLMIGDASFFVDGSLTRSVFIGLECPSAPFDGLDGSLARCPSHDWCASFSVGSVRQMTLTVRWQDIPLMDGDSFLFFLLPSKLEATEITCKQQSAICVYLVSHLKHYVTRSTVHPSNNEDT